MRKRPYVSDFGPIHTILHFTYSGIENTIKAIKDYADKSNYVNHNREILIQEESGPYEISITLPLCKRVTEKLDSIFREEFKKYGIGDMEIEDVQNYIAFYWEKSKDNDQVWELIRTGKPPCGMQYNDIIDGLKSYETCICPREFLEMCQGLTSILKKNRIRE